MRLRYCVKHKIMPRAKNRKAGKGAGNAADESWPEWNGGGDPSAQWSSSTPWPGYGAYDQNPWGS